MRHFQVSPGYVACPWLWQHAQRAVSLNFKLGYAEQEVVAIPFPPLLAPYRPGSVTPTFLFLLLDLAADGTEKHPVLMPPRGSTETWKNGKSFEAESRPRTIGAESGSWGDPGVRRLRVSSYFKDLLIVIRLHSNRWLLMSTILF